MPIPSFRQTVRGTPEKIMLQFLGALLFEAENLAALRLCGRTSHSLAYTTLKDSFRLARHLDLESFCDPGR